MFIKTRTFKRVQPGLEFGFRTFLLLQLLVRRDRLARLSGELPARQRCTDASLNCDQACCNTIHKTHDELRRMHRHATGQDKPARCERGGCWDKTEAERVGSPLK